MTRYRPAVSWIGEVGQWVGNDGSALIAGIVGAGAALLGGQVGRRRREQREDIAAWRDRRHAVYSDWLESASSFSQAVLPLLRACEGQPNARPVDDFRFDQLRSQAEDALDKMRMATIRIRLVTVHPLERTAYLTWMAYTKGFEELPPSLPTHPAPDQNRRDLVEKGFFMTDGLRKQMQRQLGLPEDE